MKRPFLLAGGASLAFHALLFLLLPSPPQTPGRPPAPPLSLRLSASSTSASGTNPAPAGSRKSAARIPSLAQAPARSEHPPEPSPAPATEAETRPPAQPDEATEAALPAGLTPEAAVKAGEEAGEGGPAKGGEGSSEGGDRGSAKDPAEAVLARLEAFVEAQKTYPEAARRRGSEGVVRLALGIAADGRLLSIRRAASSGSNLLDQAALELLRSAFPLGEGPGRELELVLAIRYRLKP